MTFTKGRFKEAGQFGWQGFQKTDCQVREVTVKWLWWVGLAGAATQHYMLPFPGGKKTVSYNRTKSPQLSHRMSGHVLNLTYILEKVTPVQ